MAQAAPGPAESTIVAVTPERILDTRDPNNLGLAGPFVSPVGQKLQVTGSIPTATGTKTVVPAGATGVLLNVTSVGSTANGFISVRPGDATGTPSTSSLNVNAGVIVPNSVQVAMPTAGANAGKIDITWDAFGVAGPTTDILIDVVGYTTNTGLQQLVADVATKASTSQLPIARSTATTNAAGAVAPGAIALSVTVQAPVPGTILVNGSASILNGVAGTFECRLTKGAGAASNGQADDLDDTDRRIEVPAASTDTHCATNGATTVAAGTHVINLVLETPTVADSFDDATLDAIFIAGGTFSASLEALDTDSPED